MKKIVEKAIAAPKKGKRAKQTTYDKELRKILEEMKAVIKVVGCGGAGNNTVDRLKDVGVDGAVTIALNTDAQDLLNVSADQKILIGRETTGGLGAGADPTLGREAARESVDAIAKALNGSDMVFITCGLGGGTGTGSAPVVAEVAHDLGALTVGIVTLPFKVEGKKRWDNAREGLKHLQKEADTVIIIQNDKLLEICPGVPINSAFRVADEILVNSVKGIIEMINKPGLINLDFADVRTIMSSGGFAMIGIGESTMEAGTYTENRAIEAAEAALHSPLLDIDISTASRALINVVGGSDMTLEEVQSIVDSVARAVDRDAHIIWGAQIDEQLGKNFVRAMVIVTGVRTPGAVEELNELTSVAEKEKEAPLDIEYM